MFFCHSAAHISVLLGFFSPRVRDETWSLEEEGNNTRLSEDELMVVIRSLLPNSSLRSHKEIKELKVVFGVYLTKPKED